VLLGRGALMKLGKRIQDLRRRRGLTTGELAARVQVTSGFISQLEHSKTDPSLQTLQRVAAALQVPLSHLLLDDELKPQVVRKDERHVIHAGNGGPRASILSPKETVFSGMVRRLMGWKTSVTRWRRSSWR
jgi:transcriptional regulator with XRE-family HTH domain